MLFTQLGQTYCWFVADIGRGWKMSSDSRYVWNIGRKTRSFRVVHLLHDYATFSNIWHWLKTNALIRILITWPFLSVLFVLILKHYANTRCFNLRSFSRFTTLLRFQVTESSHNYHWFKQLLIVFEFVFAWYMTALTVYHHDNSSAEWFTG